MRKRTVWILLVLFAGLMSCEKENDTPVSQEEDDDDRPVNINQYNSNTEGLKDYFSENHFDVGVAMNPSDIVKAERAELIKRHYSSITAENAMKWDYLQPAEGSFNFTEADKLVDFAVENGIKVRGHTLAWHSQVPDWIFDNKGTKASKELVLQRLRDHITTVMTRYKGKIYAWDVVNEAIDDGGATYRYSSWYEICGEDWIFEAFRAARQADPDAKLFYNDYSAVNPTKRDKIYDLAERLAQEGLIDGIGIQAHWNIDYPTKDILVNAIIKYAQLDLDIQFTELDVSVYSRSGDPETNYSSEVEDNLSEAYVRYFSVLNTYKGFISNVTFWGLTDDGSWLNYRDGNKDNFPLLFNADLEPKQAYFDIINL